MTAPEYGTAAAATAPRPPRDRYGLFVGGAWVDAADGATIDACDLRSGERIATVARASDADLAAAVRAARRAADKGWRKLGAAERTKRLLRFASAIADRGEALASLETLGRGTPIRIARDGVAAGLDALGYYAGWADKLAFATLPGERARPHGVVAIVGDRALGTHVTLLRLAPVLAAGNAVVLAPAAGDALGALELAEAALEAEMPPGALNVVTGARPERLLDEADVSAAAFAGSADGATAFARALAPADRPAPLGIRRENVPLIVVFANAPLDQAVDAALASLAGGTGYDRGVGARALVQEGLLASFVDRVAERLPFVRHGDPFDPNVDLGAASGAERAALAAFATAMGEAGGRIDVAGAADAPAAVVLSGAELAARPHDLRAPVLAIASFRTPADAFAASRPRPAAASLWDWDDGLLRAAARAIGARTSWVRAFAPDDPLDGDAVGPLRDALAR